MEGNISKRKPREDRAPVPQWVIAIPVVGAAIAAIVVVSGNPGPLGLAILFLAIFVLGYLYVYLIGIWRRRRKRREAS
jgi:hypothetical protein